MKLLLEELKKVITKIDTDIATEIETKYPETTREEWKRIKMKYKNVERKLEVKRKKKWEKFRSWESNQNETNNTTSLLAEDTKIPNQHVNQNSLKFGTPTLIKRSYGDVRSSKRRSNDAKSVEGNKIDERNITDNRARQNKNKVKRKEKNDGSLEKIDLKKNIFSTFGEGTE